MGATANGQSATRKYWIICAILFILTGLEFGAYEMESVRTSAALMYPIIGGLSIVKFALVCGWYMHLKGDHPILTKIFLSGLGLALIVMLIYVFSMHPMGVVQ
jgi:caa(3)-type oxidase subunit IV